MVKIQADRIITVDAIREVDPSKTYIVCVHVPKVASEEEKQALLNKAELGFKTLGIKNVKALANVSTVFEVKGK